jgi:hypothetical protein
MRSRDYEEFLAALNAHGVRYLVVGAHAIARHARPRATKDLDVWLQCGRENATCVIAALGEFFGSDPGYSVDDLLDPEWIIQLGVAPVRIDLLFRVDGCPDFEGCWQRRSEGVFGDVPTQYLSLDDLISAKDAAGRPQDRADLRKLRRAALNLHRDTP